MTKHKEKYKKKTSKKNTEKSRDIFQIYDIFDTYIIRNFMIRRSQEIMLTEEKIKNLKVSGKIK